MKRIAWSFARWLVVALLAIGPTFVRFEASDAFTFECTRDGYEAGLCYAVPTLYQRVAMRLGIANGWFRRDQLDDDSAVLAAIEDLGVATPDDEDGAIRLYSSTDCWTHRPTPHSFCQGKSFEVWRLPVVHPSTTDEGTILQARIATAHRWNQFKHDERVRSFVVRRPIPFAAWHLLFTVAAVVLAVWNIRRAAGAKTAAWLRAVAEIPPTPPMTPYRG